MSCSALKCHASSSLLSSLSTCKVCGFWQLSSPMHQHPSVRGISFFFRQMQWWLDLQDDFTHLHTVSSMIPTGAASFVINTGMITFSHICHPLTRGEGSPCIGYMQTSFPYYCLVLCELDVMLNAVSCWWQSFSSLFLLAENPAFVKYW